MSEEGFNGIKIESDFTDYYDNIGANTKFVGIYKRYMINESKGKLMKQLKDQGIKSLELKAVRDFDNSVKQLVIYTNPKLHESKGKILMSLDDARMLYPTYLASEFYNEADSEFLKYLQIGYRRFTLKMKSGDKNKFGDCLVTDIKEMTPDLNYLMMKPIFSIDYISNGKEMIAIDFNMAQRLSKLGIDKIMTAEQVMSEIKKSMSAYNII